mmetsp:Transcript_52374/g.162558  ORF Transcript_52374/g.162558 Transcript_52374/m.162558 type:complete len:213 (-) Transcript_52374:212-850(-)
MELGGDAGRSRLGLGAPRPRHPAARRQHLALHLLGQRDGRVPEVRHQERRPVLPRYGHLPGRLRVAQHEAASRVPLHVCGLVEGLALVRTVCLKQELLALLRRQGGGGRGRLPAQVLTALQDLGVPARPLREPARGAADEVAALAAIAQRRADLPGRTRLVGDALLPAGLHAEVRGPPQQVRRDVRVLEGTVQGGRSSGGAVRAGAREAGAS